MNEHLLRVNAGEGGVNQLNVSRRPGHSVQLLFMNTLAAQIHFLGAVLGLVSTFFLCAAAMRGGHSGDVWACLVFGLSGVAVFTVSSVYHFLADGYIVSPRLGHLLENLDQSLIYVFIAGTYTPFLLNAVVNPWRTYLLIFIWAISLFGVVYTLFRERMPRWMRGQAFYIALFLLMGWTFVVRWGEIWQHLGVSQKRLFFAGALCYTIGVPVYALKKPNLGRYINSHDLWHTFVLAGAIFHFMLIWGFYA